VDTDRDGAKSAVSGQAFGCAEAKEHEQADEESRQHGFDPARAGPGKYNGKTLIPRSSRPVAGALVLVMAGLVGACRAQEGTSPPGGRPAAARESARPPEAPAGASRPRIVVLGDSLTAGLGLPDGDAYPAVLQRRLDRSGYRFEVVNAGVSGDTSAGGLSRLDWSLAGDVRILIVALGGNDGLRGLPPDEMKRNLAEIIRRARERNVAVMLAGMESLTNMGPDYQRRFHDVFPALAREDRVAFLPFLLEGVAGQPELNQNDGIHPTAEGARIIADHVWRVLEPMVQAASR
jgi:acyl-CoA thioesterase-1